MVELAVFVALLAVMVAALGRPHPQSWASR
jgi:hypothetical protein